jgi:hypothetical protein
MSDRCVPERVRDFLAERPGRRYCDACIQERMGIKWRQQVQLVTATLAVTPFFCRDRGECCTCHETKHVISALRPQPQEVATVAHQRSRDTRPKASAPRHGVRFVSMSSRTS